MNQRPKPQILTFNEKQIVTNQTWAGIMAAYVEDNTFCNHISNGAIYEQDMIVDMLEPHIKRCKVMVDIGGHSGHHTIPYCALNDSVEVHTFEPQKHMFDLLNINILNNKDKCKNVRTYNMAVGNKHCETHLCKPVMKSGQNNDKYEYGEVHIGTNGEPTKMITLDSLNFQKCDWIKIDVEGAEPLVLEGATETIKRCRPIICFETNLSTENRSNFPDEFKNIEKTPHQILEDLEYVIHPLVYDNFIAFPIVKSKFKNISGYNP
jgi:FkbM family methyltransferase